MNRFVVLAIAGCIASTALSAPAYAAPILPDPSIGVRGGDSGSPDVTDGSAQALSTASCGTVDLTPGYFCAPFQFTSSNSEFEIFSLDLAFWDLSGTPIPNTVGGDCDGPCDNFNVDPNSQLGTLITLEDGFTVRLQANEGGIGFLFPEGDGPFTRDLAVFVAPFDQFSLEPFAGGFVSIQAVNGVANTNRDVAGQQLSTVPEPASLVLFGTGVVGLVARRRLRRKGEC